MLFGKVSLLSPRIMWKKFRVLNAERIVERAHCNHCAINVLSGLPNRRAPKGGTAALQNRNLKIHRFYKQDGVKF
jgi:hypothetical protein